MSTKQALEILRDVHDTLAGTADSDLDWFEDEEEEREAVPVQYAARKVMEVIELLQATDGVMATRHQGPEPSATDASKDRP